MFYIRICQLKDSSWLMAAKKPGSSAPVESGVRRLREDPEGIGGRKSPLCMCGVGNTTKQRAACLTIAVCCSLLSYLSSISIVYLSVKTISVVEIRASLAIGIV